MAKINTKVLGGELQERDADTVGELKAALGLSSHSAVVNGDPATDSTELSEEDFVLFAPSVKGGKA